MSERSPELTPPARRRMARWAQHRRAEILTAWARTQFDENRLDRYGVIRWSDLEALTSQFLGPLFDLLVACLRTGDPAYKSVYLDERLRYASSQSGPETRLCFFREIIPDDEAAVIGDADADLRSTFRAAFDDLHGGLVRTPGTKPLRLLLIGDCLMNEVRAFLNPVGQDHEFALDARHLYFSSAENVGLSLDEARRLLESFRPDVIGLSFLSYEGIPIYSGLLRQADTLSAAEIDRRIQLLGDVVREFLVSLRHEVDAPFLVHTASGLPLSRWRKHLPFVPPLSRTRREVVRRVNDVIRSIVKDVACCAVIDEEAVVRDAGYRECAARAIPARVVKRGLFHTARFGRHLAAPYAEFLKAFQLLRRTKVLLVDFDNTLWDGVMADGAVVHHRLAQQLLRQLREAGILLVAVSKNDPQSIRWDEMDLQPPDFVLRKISWDPKVDSIRDAARELNLGLDSFTLIDDNPAERHMVVHELPQVSVLDPADAFTWRALRHMRSFPNTRPTEEARQRTELYRNDAQRREAIDRAGDFAAAMTSLGLVATFRPAARRDVNRIVELVQRTNQFNTTTIRYTKPQVIGFLSDAHRRMYVTALGDRFGDLGLVGVVIVQRNGGQSVIESFVMSCRAMGFQLERAMLAKTLEAEGAGRQVIGRFVPTDGNTPAARLFADNGFRQATNTDWALASESPAAVVVPAWLTVVQLETEMAIT